MPLDPGAPSERSASPGSRSTPPPIPAQSGEDGAHEFVWRNDVRNLKPRQMSDLCGELFLATMISCDEYLMMAFQPELHPDYDRTIGALIGEDADPNRPRDYLRRWTDRLEFELKYNADDRAAIERTRNILTVLRRLDTLRSRLV